MTSNKKIYFASDQHFGAPTVDKSRIREQKFINWLDSIKEDAGVIFLLGDLFDFWFEYKKVIPRGFIRVLGKLAELKDSGIEIHFFVGNHDLWMKDYFQTELNIPVYHKPKEFTFNNKIFLIGHGDGLGPGDTGFKIMKKVFTNPISKWLFKWLHPDIGIRIAQYLSVKNKLISGEEDVKFLGEENEWLVLYCKGKLQQKHYDYFVFGHRHLPLEIAIEKKSKYINTGDWITHFSYAEFNNNQLSLNYFKI
ncbi:UDP-2,3-diacylglucosamine diphosphatase [uncultured Lutibacter sp.]|uniref:UDP-2,3-diacylglucosamine diphosphatase n=1 Tax=uncultured Lutibacter sp. TaxID=437739 RepID=UPI00261DCEC3|nr:UDP-2,3-diacylglucosamine diphosphatase [uncultured Lutibacter sp.]